MSKQQRDAIDVALRADPFGLNPSTDEHRKSFQAFALRPWSRVIRPRADISRSGASMRTKDGADPLFSYDVMGRYAGRDMDGGDHSAPLASRSSPRWPTCPRCWPPTPAGTTST
jgi:hypothetical protein